MSLRTLRIVALILGAAVTAASAGIIALGATGSGALPQALTLIGIVAMSGAIALAALSLAHLLRANRRVMQTLDRLAQDRQRDHAQLLDQVDQVRTALTEQSQAIHRGLTWQLNRINGEQKRLYPELEALIDLRASLPLRAPLPPLRGWAASPDVLKWMTTWMRDHQPRLVIECGSGTSTVLFGYLAQQTGVGRVVALEHDQRYAKQTRELAVRHGVAEWVEVRDARLQPWQHGDETWDWYDLTATEDLDEIGLLFVDGPPVSSGKLARYPAGPLLVTRLARDGIAVLDDARRTDETRVSDRWLKEIAGLDRERLPTDKGTDVFRHLLG